jgi:Na+-translocating ferredoxin:NAD+ oxidoreductase RnfG subunit
MAMLSDAVLVSAIAAIPATIAAIVTVFTRAKVNEVADRVDGRMDEMLRLTREGAFAEGVKHETDKTL